MPYTRGECDNPLSSDNYSGFGEFIRKIPHSRGGKYKSPRHTRSLLWTVTFGQPHSLSDWFVVSSFGCSRPYHSEYARSHSNSEANRCRARLVLGWGTAWEDLRVLCAFTVRPFAGKPRSTLAEASSDTVAILAQGMWLVLALRRPFCLRGVWAIARLALSEAFIGRKAET